MEIKPTLKKEAASKTEVVDTVAVQVQKVATNPSEKIPSNWTIDADKEQAFPNTSDTRTVTDVDKEIKQANADTLANRIPSNWVITPGEGDDIVAVNNITKKTFTGSVADFNSILRG